MVAMNLSCCPRNKLRINSTYHCIVFCAADYIKDTLSKFVFCLEVQTFWHICVSLANCFFFLVREYAWKMAKLNSTWFKPGIHTYTLTTKLHLLGQEDIQSIIPSLSMVCSKWQGILTTAENLPLVLSRALYHGDFLIFFVAPYEFLHDITCLMKKPLGSPYRQLVVTRFWHTLKILGQSDQLLIHLHSLGSAASTPPDFVRSGLPLFYAPSLSDPKTLPILAPRWASAVLDLCVNCWIYFLQFIPIFMSSVSFTETQVVNSMPNFGNLLPGWTQLCGSDGCTHTTLFFCCVMICHFLITFIFPTTAAVIRFAQYQKWSELWH